ncbi:MAG: hypothetical protein A4S09_10795 [Proteobacteria bacterium SG_bin7]|nr:MAG: hypothetical protein A4S09_10795 [Proteobacteria bacterium SG_bin7]
MIRPILFLAFLVLYIPAFAAHYTGKQGQIIVVKIPASGPITNIEGAFRNRKVYFFLNEKSEFVGLLGIDLKDKPGTYPINIDISYNINSGLEAQRLTYKVAVERENFHVEYFTVPMEKVTLTPKATQRANGERQQVRDTLNDESSEKLWNRDFVIPVKGRQSGVFGSYRVINGQPRSPHNGEDIAAPVGTEVLATNNGQVRMTVDHFFSGKGIYLDHGLGLYSMYFHLSEILVKEGEFVRAGQVIGRVGKTGRVTGPHLHWAVRLNGAYVNPFALTELGF